MAMRWYIDKLIGRQKYGWYTHICIIYVCIYIYTHKFILHTLLIWATIQSAFSKEFDSIFSQWHANLFRSQNWRMNNKFRCWHLISNIILFFQLYKVRLSLFTQVSCPTVMFYFSTLYIYMDKCSSITLQSYSNWSD